MAQGGPFLLNEKPEPFTREAFATPYGRALLAELGKALQTSADPACLQSKNLSEAQLSARGGTLIVTWGARALAQVSALYDSKGHEEKFVAAAGPDALAELARLRETEEAKGYVAIERPWRLARVADFILEQFDRYVLINRLKLRPVSPVASGNEALLKQSPEETVEGALEAYRDKTQSASLQCFLDLSDAWIDAMTGAITPAAARVAPHDFFRGVEDDLAALCIVKR
ncbi:MAG: hypothetical protein JO000_21715 [Alphaproteobacteria bacterium]|nr:hypothetical protein [Alphaproteobacteria bacterium]